MAINHGVFEAKTYFLQDLTEVDKLSQDFMAIMERVHLKLQDTVNEMPHNLATGTKKRISWSGMDKNNHSIRCLYWMRRMFIEVEANMTYAKNVLKGLEKACDAGMNETSMDDLEDLYEEMREEGAALVGEVKSKMIISSFQENSPKSHKTVANTAKSQAMSIGSLVFDVPRPEPLKQEPCPQENDGVEVKLTIVSRSVSEYQTVWQEHMQATPPLQDYKKPINVLMSFFNHGTNFFLQPDWLENNSLGTSLQLKCKEILRLNSTGETDYVLKPEVITIGTICAALYNDGLYYRASITGVFTDDVEVFFFDWGNKDRVKKSGLLPLDESLIFNYKIQAVKCRIRGYNDAFHKDKEWRIKKAMAREDLHAVFEEYKVEKGHFFSPKEYYVDLTVDNGRKILDVIFDDSF